MSPSVPAPPAVEETHLSFVFLTGDRAYKVLKRVDLPFLDLTDRDTRLCAAARELELNRRMAPDVYLGLADVREHGVLVDHMVVMRRLPADRRLSALAGGERFAECLRGVARAVAAFHAAQPALTDAPMASRDAVMGNWEDNLAVIERVADVVVPRGDVERVRDLVGVYLAGRGPLLDRRRRDGMIRDGHGDLRADDIFCLDDGPRIIDCLAFNDDYRIGDVLLDVAFLAMDVEMLSGSAAATVFMDEYCDFSDEHHPASLAHHYIAYRSHVRAKVAALRLAQGDSASADAVRAHHRVALDHLEAARVRMVLVGGGPGVGKTVLASGLGEQLGCSVLSSDEIRKQLLGIPLDEHRFARPGDGIYRPAVNDAVRHEQLRRAELLVSHGESVVLDASWTDERHRAAARDAAARHHAELTEIECVLDPAIAKERIARRLSNPWNPSDATPDVVDHLAASRSPWPSAHQIDTASPALDVLAEAVDLIERPRSNA